MFFVMLRSTTFWMARTLQIRFVRLTVLVLMALFLQGEQARLLAQGPLFAEEQLAIQTAVTAAEPSIVRIETVGGVDLVGDVLTGTGPTTGVVVRADGYIITSRFNFLSNPSSVMVTLPDDRKFAAEIVANDLSRMLTLLKIQADGLVPLVPVPKSEFQVGQWALALGRTFDPKFPNVSVGILSALDRVWGRAVQTDAKTSPVNYGGPLIDLTGRCLGIIVPLSPQEQGETAGVEWYDSGIGFAVPLEDLQRILPRLIAGETLQPGLMGIGFDDQGPVSGEAEVIRVRPKSPAADAGIEVEDMIVAVNGKPVVKLNDLKHVLGSMYAQDVVTLSLKRGDETLEKSITLTATLNAYQFPYLGVLADKSVQDETRNGVLLRSIFPESPAAISGLKSGDIIQKVGDTSVVTPTELAVQIRRIEPENEVSLTLLRDGNSITVNPKLIPFPNEPVKSLDRQQIPSFTRTPEAKTGRFNEQLPEDGLSFWVYAPENYRPDRPWGVLVWLHPAGDTLEADTLQAWSEVCRERGYLLVGPRAGDVSGWSPDQEAQVREAISWVEERYQIDPARVVVMGKEDSSVFASKLAFKYRDLFRGLIMFESPLRQAPPDNDPDFPLQLLFVSSSKAARHKNIVATVEALQKLHFPTWLIERSQQDEVPFPADVVSSLATWLDSLDRI